MNTFNLLVLICWLMGFIAHALLKLTKLKETGEPFNIRFWFYDNWINLSLSAIIGFFSMFFADSIFSVLGLELKDGANIHYVHAFLSGFFPDVLISKFKRHFKF